MRPLIRSLFLYEGALQKSLDVIFYFCFSHLDLVVEEIFFFTLYNNRSDGLCHYGPQKIWPSKNMALKKYGPQKVWASESMGLKNYGRQKKNGPLVSEPCRCDPE